jgi:hypothetical protein
MKRAAVLVVALGGALTARSARADGTVAYEVREEVTGALLSDDHFDVKGMCSTGSGLAPAAIYAQGGDGRGAGFGGGVGGRVGYQWPASPPPGHGLRWWGLRAGGGVDLNLMYANVATGIADASGSLCARLKSDGAAVRYKESSLLMVQMPGYLGAELGLGTNGGDGSWSGIVVGAAWAPAITYIKPWVADGELDVSYLGTELTLDFVTMHEGALEEAGKRIALFFLLPAREQGPVIMTISLGALWY